MSATGSGEGGFTLIESLTVLAIAAAIGTIAFPSIERAMNAVALVQSKQALMADLRRARGQALAGGGPVSLTVTERGRAYGWNDGVTRALPPAVELTVDARPQIAFFADGSAAPGILTLRSGPRHAAIAVAAQGVVSDAGPDLAVAIAAAGRS
jgi:type II secretion system protein H